MGPRTLKMSGSGGSDEAVTCSAEGAKVDCCDGSTDNDVVAGLADTEATCSAKVGCPSSLA